MRTILKVKPIKVNSKDMINSGREWDWMDDIVEDGIDDYISVPTTGSTTIED